MLSVFCFSAVAIAYFSKLHTWQKFNDCVLLRTWCRISHLILYLTLFAFKLRINLDSSVLFLGCAFKWSFVIIKSGLETVASWSNVFFGCWISIFCGYCYLSVTFSARQFPLRGQEFFCLQLQLWVLFGLFGILLNFIYDIE